MNASLQTRPLILYLENNQDDLFFLDRQVKKGMVCFDLLGVPDVSTALEFLRHCNSDLPAAVLLDYTLDRGSTGLEFLRAIRKEDHWRRIVIIMYSSGELPEIIATCYAEGADHFVHKSSQIDRIRDFVLCLDGCLSRRPPSFEPLQQLKEYARPCFDIQGTCDSTIRDR